MRRIFKILDKNYIEKLFEKKKNIYFPSLKNKKILDIRIKKRTPDWMKESCLASYEVVFSDSTKKVIWATAKIGESKKKAFKVLNYLYNNGFNKGTFQVRKPLDYIKEINALFYEEVKGTPLELILEKKKLPLRLFRKLAEFLFRLHSLKLRKSKAKILKLKDYRECFRELKRLTPIYQPLFPSFKKIAFLKKLQKGNYLLHGDFYPSNIIIRKNKLFLIDFDKAGEGNFLIDLLAFYFWFELPKIKPLKMAPREIEERRDVFLEHYCKLSNLNFQGIKMDLKKFKVKILLDCLHYVTFRASQGWKKIDKKLKSEFRNSIKIILKKMNEYI